MLDSLQIVGQQVRKLSDAIHWACVLEATAPKVGNVYPGKSFASLHYRDFVIAAEVTAKQLVAQQYLIARRMLESVRQTHAATSTNVNLGIVLLLGPLVAAHESIATVPGQVSQSAWQQAMPDVLARLTPEDGRLIMDAIRAAQAGGLDCVDQLDVQRTNGPVDILEAMRLAASRDQIARQYADQFCDFFDRVVPMVEKSLTVESCPLSGIRLAHLRLLAEEPDSLIARKNGDAVAKEVCDRARKIDTDRASEISDFDQWLRSDGNRLNPGTTADLIAAALFVLLAAS